MSRNFADFESFDFNTIQPIGYERDQENKKYKVAIENMKFVFELLHKAYTTAIINKPPSELGSTLSNYVEEFINHINEIEANNTTITSANFLQNKINKIEAINRWAVECFSLSSSNKFLPTCNTIINLGLDQKNLEILFLNQTKNTLETLTSATIKIKNRAEEILSELQDKASKATVSNYAKIFEEEAFNTKQTATNWLKAGIAATFSLIAFILCSFYFNWFAIIEKNNSDDKLTYNLPAVVTKVVLISLILYFITFCFKQYSVNKHLETLNKHRQNALNSYLLFTESIKGDDSSIRNNLMLQVAKAIYEHTSTGYLSNKQSESTGNGIIEMTKFISDNK